MPTRLVGPQDGPRVANAMVARTLCALARKLKTICLGDAVLCSSSFAALSRSLAAAVNSLVSSSFSMVMAQSSLVAAMARGLPIEPGQDGAEQRKGANDPCKEQDVRQRHAKCPLWPIIERIRPEL